MQEVLLRLENVSFNLEKKLILDDVSFELQKGKIVTIIGPNGSGKTTLAKIILNLKKCSKGEVWIKKGLKLGYMPQKIALNPYLPIRVENFLELAVNGIHKKEDIKSIVSEVKISHVLSYPLQSISGGELQKVLLAKALLNKPDILILDEPMQGVDIAGQVEFYKLIEKLRDINNISILMISHDLHMVMKSTDYVICLNKHICCEGTVNYIHQHKDFRNLFGDDALSELSIYHHEHNHTC